MNPLPLLPDAGMDTIVAYRGAHPVTRATFLGDVLDIAERIPNTGHILNLCRDRYWFAATLFAGITRGTLNVLPHSAAPEIIISLHQEFSDLVCLGDQPSISHQIPYIQVGGNPVGINSIEPVVPIIPADRIVMHVYTSGSTGKPQRYAKSFGRLYQCAQAEAARMWATAGSSCTVLGTVPFQHMYGLESTIFLPLLGGGRLSSRQPFFPADVLAALDELPSPRLLVTTPFHLRKLVDADIEFPPVAAIVSATAPLSADLAAETESRLDAPVIEIYGSTETGQIATRQPTHQAEWHLYDGISLQQLQSTVIATGGHLEGPHALNDILELNGSSHFRLLGRSSDMVNVAGKRSSLAYLNQVIAALPGVNDGTFCIPQDDAERNVARLAAFVVAPDLQPHDLQAALLRQLDPVFLPRPIVFLDKLPRDGNGKIPAVAMAELIARHIR